VEYAGISHFIEHLCFKGTERRPTAKELAETIDGIGGVLSGVTDKELTMYSAKVARPHFPIALDLLADMLRNSRFALADIENERKVIIEELNMCFDSPQGRVEMLIDEVIWPDQPLGRDIAGSKDSVAAVDRPAIIEHVTSNYIPNNLVVSVAGDIGHSEIVDAVVQTLGDLPTREPPQWLPADNSQDNVRIVTEKRRTEQAHLCLAVRGISHSHPDRFVLDLLNLILGEGMSSRLFLEIREQLGLAYDVHSHTSHFHDSGSVNIYAGVDPKRIEDAIEAILNELMKLKEMPVPEAEITKAKELGKGRLMLRMEDTRSVAGWIGGQELLLDRIRTVDEVISILETVSSENLQRVAQDIFRPDGLCFVMVGPSRKDRGLEKLLNL
jgi:predicted Zn-dependent peptidase